MKNYTKVFGQMLNRSLCLYVLMFVLVVGAGSVSAQDETQPVPGNIGTTNSPIYNGPWPSSSQKELVGPLLLLRAGEVNEANTELTLPLYEGKMKDGRKVWYVVTDTNDAGNANALGLNYSAKLTYAEVGKAVRTARIEKGGLVFDQGTVDFKPERSLTPGDGAAPFPPKAAQAGSIGDANYSPLVKIVNGGGFIYNAPIIAFDVEASRISFPNGNVDHKFVHDKVLRIDPEKGTVTFKLTPGFSFARPVMYLSFDSNDPVAAVLEASTVAPGLSDLQIGKDDGAFSAVERLFVFLNGPTGKENPQRQGINSAILDGLGEPLNVFGGVPTIAGDYSPMWDLNLGVWTDDAVKKGYRSRLTEEFAILRMVQGGFITGPGGKPYGSTGIIVNCPVVKRLL
jgi:hypothetical protein